MLRKEIKYKDFDGNDASDICYFNLSKTEIIKMQVGKAGGLTGFLQRLIETKDENLVVEQFDEFILKSYGVKSEDGKRFIKSPELSHAFSQSLAYDALFMELATDAEKMVEFITGLVPKELQTEMANIDVDAELAKLKASGAAALPPPPPTGV